MLLKLLLPYFTRAVSGGLVVHWHKAEGDSVEYGDDLFDMKVEEVKGIRNPMGSKEMIQVMTGPRVAERMLRAEEWMAQGFNPPENAYHITPADILLRVSASDRGILRRICVPLGEYRQVGELLGLLTTEEQEPVAEDGEALAGASTFRVVVNSIPLS